MASSSEDRKKSPKSTEEPRKLPVTETPSEGRNSCLICYQDNVAYALLECNHKDMCYVCNYRLRFLYQDKKCPFCKIESDIVIYTSRPSANFQDISLNSPFYDNQQKILFDDPSVRSFLDKMLEYRCKKCHSVFPNIHQLKSHLRVHDLRYCETCLKYKKEFISEQITYTNQEYMAHMKQGVNLQKPHPPCNFCNEYFYGDDELYHHMQQNHFSCHICERNGLMYQYYKSYASLEEHFSTDHFLCDDPSCLEKKFVVFKTEIDLKAHMLKEHGDRKGSRAVQRIRPTDLGFQFAPPQNDVRRADTRGRRNQGQPSRGESGNISVEITQRQSEQADSSSAAGPVVPVVQPSPLAEFENIQGFCPHGTLSAEQIRERNNVLVQKLKSKLPPSSSRYNEFRQSSLQLRNGEMSADQYLKMFLVIFGRQSMDLFLELINLLPNAEMQANLLRVYSSEVKHRADFPEIGGSEKASDVPASKWSSVVGKTAPRGRSNPNMTNCLRCGAEVLKSEMAFHTAIHESMDTASPSYSAILAQSQTAPSPNIPRAQLPTNAANIAPSASAEPKQKGQAKAQKSASKGQAKSTANTAPSWASVTAGTRSSQPTPPGFQVPSGLEFPPGLNTEVGYEDNVPDKKSHVTPYSHFRASESNVRVAPALTQAEALAETNVPAFQTLPTTEDFPSLPAKPKKEGKKAKKPQTSAPSTTQTSATASTSAATTVWGTPAAAPSAVREPPPFELSTQQAGRKGKKTVVKLA